VAVGWVSNPSKVHARFWLEFGLMAGTSKEVVVGSHILGKVDSGSHQHQSKDFCGSLGSSCGGFSDKAS
jgi:hypothetical protein